MTVRGVDYKGPSQDLNAGLWGSRHHDVAISRKANRTIVMTEFLLSHTELQQQQIAVRGLHFSLREDSGTVSEYTWAVTPHLIVFCWQMESM